MRGSWPGLGLLVGVLLAAAVLVWPAGGSVLSGRAPRDRGMPLLRPTVRRVPAGPLDGAEPLGRAGIGRGHSSGRKGRTGGGRWRGQRRHTESAAAVTRVLDLLAAGLRAGLPVDQAHRLAVEAMVDGPAGARGRLLADRLEASSDPGEAWAGLADAVELPELETVGRAWRLSERTGAPLAEAIALAAELVRAAADSRRRLEVALAGPRATVRLLTALPALGPLVAWTLGVDPLRLYVGSGPARAACLSGLVLLLGGLLWCRVLVRRAARTSGEAEVAVGLDLLALAMSSGVGLVDAVDAVAEDAGPASAQALRQVSAAVRWGLDWSAAWQLAGPAWAPARQALALADRAGLAPSAPLARAARDLRVDERQRSELAAARLGVQLVLPLGLAFLPAFGLLVVVPLVLALGADLLA